MTAPGGGVAGLLGRFRPFRRPLSQKTGPAIRSSYWLVMVAAGCAAARCIPDLSTYAAAPRMLTTPRCTALHVVPAKAKELTSVILLFEDQFVYISPQFCPCDRLRQHQPV